MIFPPLPSSLQISAEHSIFILRFLKDLLKRTKTKAHLLLLQLVYTVIVQLDPFYS